MIISIVTFELPAPWSLAEAAQVFHSTAPKYLDRPGLIRKHYFLAEGGNKAGGVYLWHSRADAEACYTSAWKAMVAQKYGAQPEIVFLQVPVTVDNRTHRIETETG